MHGGMLFRILPLAIEMAQKEEEHILHVVPSIYDFEPAPDEKRTLMRVYPHNLGVVQDVDGANLSAFSLIFRPPVHCCS